ncbi:MAG: LysR family transcriptional regulator [Clostridia bacterium]|nr:LysR family transcriptional regulator [Clostridia bacterium]
MDINKLKYFYTAAQLEHITRASEAMHLSQPSLTQAIRSLEEELGVPLFKRQGRHVLLTEFGEHLKKRLDILLPEFDGLALEMEQLKRTATKTVKLNILAASTFVINTIMEYKRLNPDAAFDFEQNELRYDCDIRISTNGFGIGEEHKCLQRYVKKENIYLAVPKNSKYAEAGSIILEDVRDESFVMLSNSRLFGAMCKNFCSLAGFTPKILFESDSTIAVQNIIGMGVGVAFWPEYSWGEPQNESVSLVPISDPTCRREIILELHERIPQSLYAKDFYEFLLDEFNAGRYINSSAR